MRFSLWGRRKKVNEEKLSQEQHQQHEKYIKKYLKEFIRIEWCLFGRKNGKLFNLIDSKWKALFIQLYFVWISHSGKFQVYWFILIGVSTVGCSAVFAVLLQN